MGAFKFCCTIACSGFIALLAYASASRHAGLAAEPLNVLFILVDDSNCGTWYGKHAQRKSGTALPTAERGAVRLLQAGHGPPLGRGGRLADADL